MLREVLGRWALGGVINSSDCHTVLGRRGPGKRCEIIPSILYLLMTDDLFWPVGYAARVKRSQSSRYSVAFCVLERKAGTAAAAAVFSAAQWLTSCAVRGTSSWQLMHTFSVLISPSQPLAGSKVVIIANSSHVVASGWQKRAATSAKTQIYATLSIGDNESNHIWIKNWFSFG